MSRSEPAPGRELALAVAVSYDRPMSGPVIAVGPVAEEWAMDAVRDGGGVAVALDESAGAEPVGLVWTAGSDTDGLARVLHDSPRIGWVQLPAAGVERFATSAVLRAGPRFTCAKGAYGEPVAEHALLLALALLRGLPERVRARTWGSPAGTCLFDERVTIVGGGGIAQALLRLLEPFRVRATVVRRSAVPLPGAARTVATRGLVDALPGSLVVFLALSLTPETTRIIGAAELARMDRRAVLVNVARGAVCDTEALVAALATGAIAGAGLDVTDPEPLPDDHPLWSEPHCIVTPHTADTWEMIRPLLARRIATNVRLLAADEPLEGLVDPAAGY